MNPFPAHFSPRDLLAGRTGVYSTVQQDIDEVVVVFVEGHIAAVSWDEGASDASVVITYQDGTVLCCTWDVFLNGANYRVGVDAAPAV